MKKVSRLSLIRMFSPYLFKVPLRFSLFSYTKFKDINPHWLNNKIWISSLIPSYPSESFNRYMDILVNNKRLPQHAYLAVTSRCPYHCPFCSYGHREIKDLSTKQWIDLINQLKDLGTAVIGITGGEPLIRKDLEEIIKAASPEISTVIFTTGYKLTQTRINKLVSAGTSCISLGLEYANSEKQDQIKGAKGSFQYAKNAIKLCNDAGIFSSIATIGTKEKIKTGELERIYDLATEWKIREIRLISPVATGRWLGNTNEILGPEEFQQLKQFHIKHNKTRRLPIITWTTYYESPELFGCLTGYQYIYIDAAGNICPCDLTPLSFGNATEEPIREIWNRMAKTFPRPRQMCLMNEIADKINSENLPIEPKKSKELVPELDKNTPLPKISKYLKK